MVLIKQNFKIYFFEEPNETLKRIKSSNIIWKEKVVVSTVTLQNYDKLNKYLESRDDYNLLTNQTCAGVAADILREGRSTPGKIASFFGKILSGAEWTPGGMFPSRQRPTLSSTYKSRKGNKFLRHT